MVNNREQRINESNKVSDELLGKTAQLLATDAMKDNDALIRKHAIFMLGFSRNTEHIDSLIKALKDPEKAVRNQAARALAEIGEPASERLIQSLDDPDWKVRYRAAEALGLMKNQGASGPLIDLLHDEKDHVRYMAVKSLGLIGDPVAREPLRACQQDENHYVRTLASSIICRLSD